VTLEFVGEVTSNDKGLELEFSKKMFPNKLEQLHIEITANLSHGLAGFISEFKSSSKYPGKFLYNAKDLQINKDILVYMIPKAPFEPTLVTEFHENSCVHNFSLYFLIYF
jgi:hypothetical protein